MRAAGTAVLAVVTAALVVACASTAGRSATGPAGTGVALNVAAAASLRTAVERLTAAYAAVEPSVTFTVTTDSSAALRTQIEQGAAVDVFLAADTRNPQALVDAGLADGQPTVFAANTLALVVPADDPGGLATPDDLAKPGLRLIAAGEEVPITTYADTVLAALAGMQPAPEAWLAAVRANIVSREDNVAAVLARISLGEGDAGFVYATDAVGGEHVRMIAIPERANVRATHAGIVPTASAEAASAAAFLQWVAGPEGQAVLRPLGFLAP